MKPVIETDRTRLRPFELSDAPALARIAGDERIARMVASVPSPYPELAAESWILTHEPGRRAGTDYCYAVEDRDGALIGAAGLHRCDEGWTLGYWIAPDHWGRGYASEAVGALLKAGRRTLNLRRVHAGYFPDNPASGRVLAKLGFEPSGETYMTFSLGRLARVETVEMVWRAEPARPAREADIAARAAI